MPTTSTRRRSPKTPAAKARLSGSHGRVRRHVRRYWHFHVSGLALVLVAVALLGTFWSQQRHSNALPGTPAGKVWKLTWGDEFSAGLDTSKWNVENNTNYGGGNKEDQCYRPSNVAVNGGTLKLMAKRETVTCGATNPDTGNKTYYYTSGLVTTRAQGGPLKFKFKQGYAEARLKAPKGNPYWPAFWLVSPNDGSTPGWPDYGEFDVMELYGARPDITTGSLHYKCTKGDGHCQLAPTWYNIKTDSSYGGQSTLGYHVYDGATFAYNGATQSYQTYGFQWEGDRLTWYVNGRKTRYFDGTNLYRIEQNGSQTLENTIGSLGTPAIPFSTVFNYDHSIILNLAVGGNGPRYNYYGYTGYDTANGYVDGNLVADNPGTMEVDYVRVYQLGAAATPPPTPTPPPPSNPTPTEPETPPATPTTPAPQTATPVPNTVAAAPTMTDPTTGNTVVVPHTDNVAVNGQLSLEPKVVSNADTQATVAKVEFYVDGTLVATKTTAPFTLDTTQIADGKRTITQKTYYKDGKVDAVTRTLYVKNTANTQQTSNQMVQTAKIIAVVAFVFVVLTVLYFLFGPRRFPQVRWRFWRR
jgi:beta-glucanase (GH16 family)